MLSLEQVFSYSDVWWSMMFSENRLPPRIKSGAGFFGIMLWTLTVKQQKAAAAMAA
jgi:hypothetical protein